MMPTIQDVIDKTKVYLAQGVSLDEAVRLATKSMKKSADRQKKNQGRPAITNLHSATKKIPVIERYVL